MHYSVGAHDCTFQVSLLQSCTRYHSDDGHVVVHLGDSVRSVRAAACGIQALQKVLNRLNGPWVPCWFRLCVCAYIYYICMYVCMYIHVCVCVCMGMCVRVCACVCMRMGPFRRFWTDWKLLGYCWVRLWVCIYLYMYMRVCVCACTFVYMCMCVHACACKVISCGLKSTRVIPELCVHVKKYYRWAYVYTIFAH